MTATYDLGTDIGKVRLLIPDTDTDDALFSDEELQVFLDLEDDEIEGAVARALETIAGDQMLVFRVNVRSDDGTVTASETTKLMLQRAREFRERVDSVLVISGGETWLSAAPES